MTRREQLYPEIRRLREDEGLKWREITARLGLALSTVQDYYAQPTAEGARARRERYTGTCVDCGGKTNNGGAASGPPERCRACANPPWTPEAILEALRDWGDDHGGIPPRQVDTRTGHEGHGRLPHTDTVRDHFENWNAALLAAGFEALRCDRRPETQAAIEAAIRAGEDARDVADRYGVTPQAIYERFRVRGLSVQDLRPEPAA